MIYELMNNRDFKLRSTSFIVSIDLADEFVADVLDNESETEGFYHEYTDVEIEDILNENKYFVVSRNYYDYEEYVEYFIEPLIHEDGKQYELESDYIVIENGLVDIVDFKQLFGEILTFEIYEEDKEIDNLECDDELEEFLDYITEDLLKDLDSEDECPHCAVRAVIDTVYKMAYEQAMEDVADSLYEVLDR